MTPRATPKVQTSQNVPRPCATIPMVKDFHLPCFPVYIILVFLTYLNHTISISTSTVKVASVSYSGVEGSLRREAATYCRGKGSLMVHAAGNLNDDLSEFGNADDDDLIVAGGTTVSNSKYILSNYGTFVDVMAPGKNVRTTDTGSGYISIDGTSFSAPLAAGLVALIWSADPNFGTPDELTPDEVEAILKAGTVPHDLVSENDAAYGLINSRNSVVIAASGTFPVSFYPWDSHVLYCATNLTQDIAFLPIFCNSPRHHQHHCLQPCLPRLITQQRHLLQPRILLLIHRPRQSLQPCLPLLITQPMQAVEMA